MKYLLLVVFLIITGCFDITDPSGMNVTLPVTYIEWEVLHPQDTTWWTFRANGECYAAWKRKITEVSGAPPWVPHCMSHIDASCNCCVGDAWRTDGNGNVIGTDGRTYEEYLDFWAAQIAGWLPIEYYAGTWDDNDGIRLTIAVNRVIPGSYGGIACDMQNPTYITSQYEPQYIMYDFWRTDSLYGYQSDEDGNRIELQHSEPNVKFSQWHGKHLFNTSNPIFDQL